MKNLVNYYNASRLNKFRVIVAIVLTYFFLYLSANPHTYDMYFFKIRLLFSELYDKFSTVVDG